MPSLEAQTHQAAVEEAHQEAEEAHQVEEEMHKQQFSQMENPWEHYQQLLKEIA